MKRERNAEVVRRVESGERMADVARSLGISRQRVDQIVNLRKSRARGTLNVAVAAGDMIRPGTCEQCGNHRRQIEAHHDDYDAALDVRWLCTKCHGAADRAMHEREARRVLGLASDAVILTTGEAASAAHTATPVVRAAISAGEVPGFTDGRGFYVSESAVMAWEPRHRAAKAAAKLARRRTHCKRGHPLEPWNVTQHGHGQLHCSACNALNVRRVFGGAKTGTATQYEVRAAFVRCGFSIVDNAAGRVMGEGYGDRVRARRGRGNPWQLSSGNGAVSYGSCATAADVEHRLREMFAPEMQKAA